MANYLVFKPTLQKIEGGYLSAAMAAQIKDSGGETYRGVSRNNNPTSGIWAIIDEYKRVHGIPKWNSIIPDANLNRMVDELTKSKYWDKLRLDTIKNQSLANYMMDFGFNSGTGTVANIVQRLVKVPVDGIIGALTVNQINKANQKNLFDALIAARVSLIKNSGKINPDLKDELIERAESFFFQAESEQVQPL